MLAASLAYGCGSNTTDEPTERDDAGADGDADGRGDGEEDGNPDGEPGDGLPDEDGSDDAGQDAGPCVPMGCDEVGATCGTIDDGCGGTVNCDPGGVSPCTGFDTCGGDPAKPYECGCKPKTCEDYVNGPAGCGVDLADGCGGTLPSCGDGNCSTLGANYDCADDYSQCNCVPTPKVDACYGKTCSGSEVVVEDGCGNPVDCGPCGAGEECVASGDAASCVCVDSQSCCVPKTVAEACGTQVCGSADNGCGGTVNCGGCPAGQACAEPTYNLDSNQHACIPQQQAQLLGKYLARMHSFRNSSAPGGNLNRAEALSLITIERTGGALRMRDLSCVGASVNSAGRDQTLAPNYWNVPQVVVPLTLPTTIPDAADWVRDWLTGQGQPAGFVNYEPPYCSNGTLNSPGPGATAGDFDTTVGEYTDLSDDPTADTGPNKSWLGNTACTCPTSNIEEIPAQNLGSPSNATDCRINDLDRDGFPGFSTLIRREAGATTLRATAAVFANVKWSGLIDPTGRHTGFGTEPAKVVKSFLSCRTEDGGNSVLCPFLSLFSDWSCGDQYNLITFRRLQGEEVDLECLDLYDHAPPFKSVDDLNSERINSYFGAIAGTSCTGNGQCPADAICQSGRCWPMTTPGACSNGVACRTGWTCGAADSACWPSTCPQPPASPQP